MNFEQVWLSNIGEAKRQITEMKEYDTYKINEQDVANIKKEIPNITSQIKDFDLGDFIKTYIDIAEKKWKIKDESSSSYTLFEQLKKTHKLISTFINNNKPKIDKIITGINNTAHTVKITDIQASLKNNNTKEIINSIEDILNIGKYVILEENQISNVDVQTVTNKLNELTARFKQQKTQGGKKRKTRYRKKNIYKKPTKKIKQSGGKCVMISVILILTGLITFAGLSATTFGIGGGLILLGILSAIFFHTGDRIYRDYKISCSAV